MTDILKEVDNLKKGSSHKTGYKSNDKDSSETRELSKLNEVFLQYELCNDAQLKPATSFQCLMELEGCEKEFQTKKDMYTHLVTECCFFVCRLCAKRVKSEDKAQAKKPEITCEQNINNKSSPINVKESSKTKLLHVERHQRIMVTFDNDYSKKTTKQNNHQGDGSNPSSNLAKLWILSDLKVCRETSFFLFQIKQAAFFCSNDLSKSHTQNTYSSLISTNDVIFNLSSKERINGESDKFCIANVDNIVEEYQFLVPIRLEEYSYSHNSLCFNINTRRSPRDSSQPMVTYRVINNKNKSLNFSQRSFKSEKKLKCLKYDEGETKELISVSITDLKTQSNSAGNSQNKTANNERVGLLKLNAIKSNEKVTQILNNFEHRLINKLNNNQQSSSPPPISKTKFKIITQKPYNFSNKQEFKCDSPILAMDAWSEKGLVATAQEDSKISVFELNTSIHRRYCISNPSAVGLRHNDEVVIIKFLKVLFKGSTKNKQLIKIVTFDRRGTLIVWQLDKETTNLTSTYELEPIEVLSKCAIGAKTSLIVNRTNDEALILVGTAKGELITFIYNDTAKMETLRLVAHHRTAIVDFLYFITTDMIVSASNDGKITFWNSSCTPKSTNLEMIDSCAPALPLNLNLDQLQNYEHNAKLISLQQINSVVFGVLYDDSCLKFYSTKTYKLVKIVKYPSQSNRTRICSFVSFTTKFDDKQSMLILCLDNKEMAIVSSSYLTAPTFGEDEETDFLDLEKRKLISKIYETKLKASRVVIINDKGSSRSILMLEKGSQSLMKYNYD